MNQTEHKMKKRKVCGRLWLINLAISMCVSKQFRLKVEERQGKNRERRIQSSVGELRKQIIVLEKHRQGALKKKEKYYRLKNYKIKRKGREGPL